MKKLIQIIGICLVLGLASCNDGSEVKRLVRMNGGELRVFQVDTIYHVGEVLPAEFFKEGTFVSGTIIR